jgi:aminoglycoside phosphotransferase (APT) family kinase protein
MQGNFQQNLKNALNEMQMREALLSVTQAHFGSNTSVTHVAAEHLQRRLIRYTVQLDGVEKENRREWKIIGKIYGRRPQMDRSFEMMRHLWMNGFSRAATDRIGIPEPMLSLPDLCLILMPEVRGVPLRLLIKERRATPAHMQAAAKALAKLHRCPLLAKPPLTVEALIEQCNPSPYTLAQAYRELAPVINDLIEKARRIANNFGDDIFTLVHGDFHLGHVLVDEEQIWLLDFDQLNCGDPAYDVAEIFAFLKRSASRKKASDYFAELKDTFMAHYFSQMGWEIAGRVPLYEALLHLKRACKCFRVQDESGWEEQMRLLVEQSRTCMKVFEKEQGKIDFNKALALYESCPGAV